MNYDNYIISSDSSGWSYNGRADSNQPTIIKNLKDSLSEKRKKDRKKKKEIIFYFDPENLDI